MLLIYNLGAQWSVYEQYRYGWSVPFLCAWLAWKRIEGNQSKVQSLNPKVRVLPSSIFYLLLAFVALLYAPTRFLHEANPIWPLTSFLWSGEVIGLTLLMVSWWTVGGVQSESSS